MIRSLPFLALAALLAAPPAASAQEVPDRLPVFRLGEPDVSERQLQEAARLIGLDGRATRQDGALVLGKGAQTAEIDLASGALWVADRSQLWNPDLRPDLPSDGRAQEDARELLEGLGLLKAQGPFSVEPLGTTRTHAAFFDADRNRRSDHELDVRATFGFKVEIEGLSQPVPVLGADYSVSFGDGGKPIAVEGHWLAPRGVLTEAQTIPADAAIESLLGMADLSIERPKARLVYVSGAPGRAHPALYPAWAVSGTAKVGSESVPLREVLLPATEYGPALKPVRAERRAPDFGPQRRSTVPEEQEGRGPYPTLVPEAWRLDEPFRPGGAEGYKEAATAWIGASGGLPNSGTNAGGFVDGLRGPFDAINFNFGDAAAWETDWTTNDDTWVDAADFVFYTGHANGNGWQTAQPSDTFVHFNDVDTAGDHLGANDLEWLVVAACGPLQDSRVAGSGNVFDRWMGMFNGLHLFMGYAAVTYDNVDEGRLLARYAKRGQPLVDAWFRTAREVQPTNNSTEKIYVGVVYGYEPSKGSPRNDHLHGKGPVVPDSKNPTRFVGIYTGT